MPFVGLSRNLKLSFVLALTVGSASAQVSDGAQGRAAFVQQYCIGCHSEGLKTGGLVLENVDAAFLEIGQNAPDRAIALAGGQRDGNLFF